VGSAPEQDRLLSRSDAAERLALSVRTLDTLHQIGALEKVHVLGAVRFRESDVQRVIREGIRLGQPDAGHLIAGTSAEEA
jgi:hypothetical protein